MKKIYSFLISVLIIYSCSTPLHTDSNQIVLLVHNPPIDSLFRFDMGAIKYVPSVDDITFALYINDSLQEVKLKAYENLDTLKIETNRDFVELLYCYQLTEDIHFYVKRGDTVDICFDERKLPLLSSRTDKKLDLGYNYISNIDYKRLKYNFLPFVFMDDIFFSAIRRMKDQKKSFYNADVYDTEYFSLDTLQNEIEKFNVAYNTRIHSDSLLPAQKCYLEYQLRLLNSTKENYLDFSLNDSLIYNSSYHRFLAQNFLGSYRVSKNIPSGADVNGKFTEQGGEESYAMLFDTLSMDASIPSKSKLLLLETCLRNMKRQGYCKLKDYAGEYLAQGGGRHLVSDLLGIIEYSEFNTLKLVDSKGVELTFQEVLDKNSGKVVYLDFWGTNCTPCIHSMPSGRELREELNGEDVVFVYIALWDNKDIWDKRQKEFIGEKINYESYFAVNSKDAKMLTDFQVYNIPRYMIFNPSGELVNDNAPGAINPNIRQILSQEIK